MAEITRREFTKLLAATGVAASLPTEAQTAQRMIGIQVGAVSFVDEGVVPVLDRFQHDASINTLFLATFTYGRGIAGRQVPGQPLPDHGKQAYDFDYHGGNYGTVHSQYYKDTGVQPEATRSPDHGNLDIIAEVVPRARKRGMRTILWTEDVWRYDLPGSTSFRRSTCT